MHVGRLEDNRVDRLVKQRQQGHIVRGETLPLTNALTVELNVLGNDHPGRLEVGGHLTRVNRDRTHGINALSRSR
jgi:hypothetical protein